MKDGQAGERVERGNDRGNKVKWKQAQEERAERMWAD